MLDNTWIACLARQTGRLSIVSRWLLMLAMMLCIVSMMWICVTIIRTAPKRRLRQVMILVKSHNAFKLICSLFNSIFFVANDGWGRSWVSGCLRTGGEEANTVLRRNTCLWAERPGCPSGSPNGRSPAALCPFPQQKRPGRRLKLGVIQLRILLW